MELHINYGNNETEKWESFPGIPFLSLSKLHPEDDNSDHLYGIDGYEITLPNGEKLIFNAVYDDHLPSVNIVVLCSDITVLNITTYKRDSVGYDPSIVFYTPSGNHITLMLGHSS